VPDTPPRIIVHLARGIGDVPQQEGAQQALSGAAADAWTALNDAFPELGLSLNPVVRAQGADSLRDLMNLAEARSGETPPDLLSLMAVDVAGEFEADLLVDAVQKLPFVELAYVESPISQPQPVSPVDDPLAALQTHLLPAPFGLGALQAWSRPGADGANVRYVDIEYGWNLGHEDLAGAGVVALNASVPGNDEHSTACLGIVLAQDNTVGVIGLAPKVTAAIASALGPTLPDAFVAAVGFLQAGDVLLIEVQAGAGRPVEIDPHIAFLIRGLTLAGIVVVEPAGNGAADLDALVRADGTGFQRGAFNFYETGAIMVGARQALMATRAPFSTFGSRVDCHAFGEGIVTASAVPGSRYRGILGSVLPGMDGTSGASAIIAGAAVIMQGIARPQAITLTPDRMRSLLSDTTFNTATANPASDRIGVMPDLGQAPDHI
jgi:hypothetical protein